MRYLYQRTNLFLVKAVLVYLSIAWLPLFAQPSSNMQTAQLLSEAREPVRIVCFGDSITGVYYHSGNRRAWPEMLKVALNRLYPKADIKVINAGISGNTTVQGLVRMQKDVLAHNPHLVVVMYGMNDLAYGAATPEKDDANKAAFVDRLKTIIGKCRDAHAEVILCTQNPVYTDALPRRPKERVGEFARLICQVGKEAGVPVADIYTEWEALRTANSRAWKLLMSETIHPSMAGHKRMAERVAETLSGRTISLADVLPEQPVCCSLIACLKENKPVTIVAPAPLAPHVRAMVLKRFPSAALTVTPLSEKGLSLNAITDEYKKIRNLKPTLVFISLVPDLLTFDNEETFIRQVSWIVNWSLPFGGSSWTAVGVDPALMNSKLTKQQQEGANLLREITRGHDLDWISQPSGENAGLETVLHQWFDKQTAPNN
ncbi:MAG: SGNH/GDSL hydrolase family protein [Kiritimatiellae bacterium]|nr:SGNH/GDSL hydrolase family protein [Kiritimatiellia bacterium]MDD5519261.1 SGNH/GDSL hydrolase family protein [Kiritimatiellia bacterium]